MPKINQEEYESLKSLDDKWKWIARDEDRCLYALTEKPVRKDGQISYWGTETEDPYAALELFDERHLFQFIQWEDESPCLIAELIEEYEYWQRLMQNPTVANLVGCRKESGETEVKKDIEWLKKEIKDKYSYLTSSSWRPEWQRMLRIDLDTLFALIDQLDEPVLTDDLLEDAQGVLLQMKVFQHEEDWYKVIKATDEPEPKDIILQDIILRLWELPLNNRKLWLARLNDEFQEGYIVPLGLKTTDGEEQYLTYNGSYFASRRNRYLQQTFATLEEIPEFYRDLAERVL